MKARVKATGEIVDVTRIVDRYVMTHHPHTITFEKDELDFDIEDELDYWTRLEHTYAGMAMQGILTNLGNTVDPDQDRYAIANFMGNIEKSRWDYGYSITFVFPTEEMRDAFYENFKKEIEICKELL